jgi:hypothetical protein
MLGVRVVDKLWRLWMTTMRKILSRLADGALLAV